MLQAFSLLPYVIVSLASLFKVLCIRLSRHLKRSNASYNSREAVLEKEVRFRHVEACTDPHKCRSIEFRGPIDCVLKTLRQEGILGLFRGYSAMLLRDIPFNFFFFGAYNFYTLSFTKLLGVESKKDLHPLMILVSGGMAGATGWSIVFPADVLKSHMQTASVSSAKSLGLRDAARLVYNTHGYQGFYRGWTAAVSRAFPANGSLFLGVEMTHRIFRFLESERE